MQVYPGILSHHCHLQYYFLHTIATLYTADATNEHEDKNSQEVDRVPLLSVVAEVTAGTDALAPDPQSLLIV